MAETTFAVTSGVDHEPLDSLTAAADTSLPPASPTHRWGWSGLEIEAHCFDVADPLAPAGVGRTDGVIESVPELPGGSLVTVEPGGAVELSGPPVRGAVAGDRRAWPPTGRCCAPSFAEAGLAVWCCSAPTRCGLPRGSTRATGTSAMEQFFAASAHRRRRCGDDDVDRVGAGQRRRRPAPTDWADRVRLAHALGPTMIAIAANSPLLGGGVLRVAQHAPAGVESTGLGAVRADPRRERRRPGQRLGALRAAGAGDAGAQPRSDAGHQVGAVRGLGRRAGRCSATADRRPPTWTTT